VNIDTGEFRAIQARADAVDAITAGTSGLGGLRTRIEDLSAMLVCADHLITLGQILEREEAAARRRAPRHARPRGERPAYLRLVGGAR
jgi:hypothetical protein